MQSPYEQRAGELLKQKRKELDSHRKRVFWKTTFRKEDKRNNRGCRISQK